MYLHWKRKPDYGMSHSTSARPLLSSRDTSYLPSAPIPIPHIRRVTDPPPRSPTRQQSSPDLIFEMSPHVSDETPLLQRKNTLFSNNAEICLTRKFSLPFANRVGSTQTPCVHPPPYWEEPFLYSIPRLPTRPPFHHSRTRSAVVKGSRYTGCHECMNGESAVVFPSIFSVKSLSSAGAPSASCSDTSHSDQETDEILTTAFRQSCTSPSSSFSLSEKVQFEHPISLPTSFKDEKTIEHPIQVPISRNKSHTTKINVITPLIRTSAAEPIVSFAQAELKHSPSSGVIARVVAASKDHVRYPLRTHSPYSPRRGRRKSVLRNRTAKASDDDIVGTLDDSEPPQKLGFERFLPPALSRRRAADENNFVEELPERGRTRSRNRLSQRF